MNLKTIRLAPFALFVAQLWSRLGFAASNDEAQAAAGCAVCGGGMLMMLVVPLVIQIAVLAWVVKDARARQVESPMGWMIFVFLVPLVGLLVYLFSRPPLNPPA